MQEQKVISRIENLQLSDIVNDFLHLHKEKMEILTLIHLTAQKNEIKNLETLNINNIPIYSIDTIQNSNVDLVSINTIEWTNKKIMEDLTNIAIMSVKKAIRFKNTFELSQFHLNKPFIDENELNLKLEKIKSETEKIDLPRMIYNLEYFIGKELKFSEEVKSINKTRNCLVHRNGIVHKADTNDKNRTRLELKTIEPKTFVNKNDIMIPLTYEMKINTIKTDQIQVIETPNDQIFEINEKITINTETIFNIGYTFNEFVVDLMKKLKECFETRVNK